MGKEEGERTVSSTKSTKLLKLRLALTPALTLTDTGGAFLTLMLGYRKKLLKVETHQNCRIEISKRHCFTCWLCKKRRPTSLVMDVLRIMVL